ncbi:amidase [Williamwhitmania taraxaci]|uniref:Asp-tRNAAsn/Glu-tRNAGln amidotransferase A subunit n=1 Tax=Williamwhitmania taraxaci TaxID=1640674 RepID=A0A1G6IJS4_9BACT|nr:amidase [Williamwhitmania taraxaci]SDC06660.1 Asp-tRNAAsn/Glu-tRNAGln amidotransferase A subunit [Williamwhitmania taraxaci]
MKKKRIRLTIILSFLIVSLVFNAILLIAYRTNPIKSIELASQLLDLSFTRTERDSMVEGVLSNREKYKAIHAYPLNNSTAPATIFAPVPANYPTPTIQEPINFGLPKVIQVPRNRESLCFFSVAELSSLMKSKKITSVELTKLYLGRIKKYDQKLNTVITLLEETALAQAKQADKEIAAGKYRGPLHGIPYGVKDLLALKTHPTTWGSPIYRSQMIMETASVISKLDSAGAILVAKLSLGELAMDDVWFGGKTRNPWNTNEGSSGSSAGPASATSAGLVAFSIGSETWGSIVSPSTVCGVTGLRPTFGRVSRTGAMALSWTMDKIGPICRTAQDAAIVFDAIKGPDGKDITLENKPFNLNLGKANKALRIGYVASLFTEKKDSNANDFLALETMKQMGYELIAVNLPNNIPVDALSIILEAEAAAAFSDLTLTNLDNRMVLQTKNSWPNIFRTARLIPATEYIQANRIRTHLIQEFTKLFQQVDIIVCPSFGGNQLLATNLTGHPALCLPDGFDKRGMPTSITFIADWYNEANLLEIGWAFQQKQGFHLKHPELFMPGTK